MDTAAFLPLILWLVFAVILLFRRSLPLYIRLVSFMILAFYLMFWYKELHAFIAKISALDKTMLMTVLYQTCHLAFLALLWIWPLSLLYIFITSDDKGARIFLLVLVLFSFAVWCGYVFTGFQDLRQHKFYLAAVI